jgi:NO-binding membrane sensor protein with MHYT domain
MAFSTSAIGIFGMHLMGMVSVHLFDKNDFQYHIEFDVGMTIVCTIIVVVFTIIGMIVASGDPLYAMSRSDVIEEITKDVPTADLQQFKNLSELRYLILAGTYSLQRIFIAGLITALGIVVMHYLNMVSNQYDGFPIAIEWNEGVVASSVIIAIIAATAAQWVLFRFLSIYPHSELIRNLCAVIFTIAKCAVHYTGAAAASYKLDSDYHVIKFGSALATPSHTTIGCLIAAFVSSLAIVLLVFSDLRTSNIILNIQIRKAEQVIVKMKADPRLIGATASVVQNYKFAKPNKALLLASRVEKRQVDQKVAKAAKWEELMAAESATLTD